MKNLKIILIAVCFYGIGTAKAQIVSAATISGVYEAVVYTSKNWNKVGWFFGGMDHTWWYCKYQDGFVTYNNFRSYRTSADAYKYFVLGHGDCDARYYDVYGKLRSICYQTPFQARYYTNQHGPIIDIGFKGNDRRYHSILNY